MRNTIRPSGFTLSVLYLAAVRTRNVQGMYDLKLQVAGALPFSACQLQLGLPEYAVTSDISRALMLRKIMAKIFKFLPVKSSYRWQWH